MTNEEAIKHLKTYDEPKKVREAFEMAIKALEQEPILDKIRAEIADMEEGISSYFNDRPWVFKDEVLQIIDKYRNEVDE